MHPKYVLITGTSSGIGAATVKLLADSGYTVFAGVRNEKALQAWQQNNHPQIIPLQLDVTHTTAIDEAYQKVAKTVGNNGLYALINNAGNCIGVPTELFDEEAAKHLMETHFWGMAKLCKAFIPLLRKYVQASESAARIINVGSAGSISSFPFIQFYNAAKFAILGFTESIRFELAPQNIHCSAILPGAVKTEIWNRAEESIKNSLQQLSHEGAHLYRDNIVSALQLSNKLENKGVSPEAAALVYKKVLESPKPRLKYFIGADSKLMHWMVRYLPDALRHSIINTQLKFKKTL
ncbi:MAG TPA: SDR family NAD(P)-dependent oxidoreductase [Haliscomenobacter sp.]|uniref:SDR family NAD(P)-dependent oxidoreductase n=1 Tax=Haliscomenobacter sp. TaxID=2717303 RepID=UPI002BB110D2|nr:SDR family NAD(P)-dependent oxidoreductase [Haliscomenobacter sp.]HOY20772.1 SDR family NAD(P)-dependent oxidoreductase [Haliscomenobacter sp.]